MAYRPSQPRSGGFTLIELLVAIGVIAILIGLVTVGVRSVVENGKRKQTRAILQSAEALLNEYNVEMNGKKGITQWWWNPTPPLTTPNVANPDITTYALDFQVTPYRTPVLALTNAAAPLPVPSDDATSSWQMQNTAMLMLQFSRLPATAKLLAQLPSHGSVMVTGPALPANGVPMLLDGWGNPILFVPGSGLGDGTTTASVFMGAKIIAGGALSGGTQLPTIKTANGRPFFVSAGPDGDFRTGDDNIYSFGH